MHVCVDHLHTYAITLKHSIIFHVCCQEGTPVQDCDALMQLSTIDTL